MVASRKFAPSQLDNIEDIENYERGGYHPTSIGDTFDQGRYRILHKLGYGGSSTVWLARDQREGKNRGKIVTLKAMRADISTYSLGVPELAISKLIASQLPPYHSAADFQTVDHHFLVEGPNGSHRFLIFPFAGPSIRTMSCYPGRSRRLRADLARKVAKQTATTLHHMHRAGVVHGDLTTSNILFRVSPHVIGWSDTEVYGHLGNPETEEVITWDGTTLGPHAPAMLVEPIQSDKISHSSLLQESTIITDFGQSYVAACPPPLFKAGTIVNYASPETRFERRAGFEADIWTLACVIFELRAGFSLFESFLGGDTEVLIQTVDTLGRLPDPWWGAFAHHSHWFEEDGRPKSKRQDRLVTAHKSSIRMKLLEIGKREGTPYPYDRSMVEKSGVRLTEEEIDLLEDLLQKMLKYIPEERIRIQDVIRHPWFTM